MIASARERRGSAASAPVFSPGRASRRDRRGVDVDREEQRPDLVVQVARKVGAFLVLQAQELFGKPAVAGGDLVEAKVHVVEPVREPPHLRRTERLTLPP